MIWAYEGFAVAWTLMCFFFGRVSGIYSCMKGNRYPLPLYEDDDTALCSRPGHRCRHPDAGPCNGLPQVTDYAYPFSMREGCDDES